MFTQLEKISVKPALFDCYTAAELWTNEHTSRQMLEFHLNEDFGMASRKGAFINKSVAWMIDHLKIGPDTCIADFGCGPGLYTSRLARTGARVTGIDFSQTSLEYARQYAKNNGLPIKYIQCNYLEFETEERYDLITLIFCDFCALSPSQRGILLEKFRKYMKPGGTLFFDVHSMNGFEDKKEGMSIETAEKGGFWSPNPYYCFQNTFKYEENKVFLDKYTIVEKDQTRVVYNWIECFSPDKLKAELATYGLEVVAIFSDVAGRPFEPGSTDFAVVARVAE